MNVHFVRLNYNFIWLDIIIKIGMRHVSPLLPERNENIDSDDANYSSIE